MVDAAGGWVSAPEQLGADDEVAARKQLVLDALLNAFAHNALRLVF